MLKKISAFVLTALCLLSLAGCGNTEAQIVSLSAKVTGYSAFGGKGNAVPNLAASEKAVCENDYLTLLYDTKTCVVTVFDKRTSRRYSTANPNETANSNNSNLAALKLFYSDTQGKSGSIDSYTKSVVLNQTDIVTGKDFIEFTYRVGDVSDGIEVTPSIISNTRFQALLDKADDGQKKILQRRYSYIKDYDNWSRRKLANPAAIQELVDVFATLGYTAEDLATDNAENGIADTGNNKLAFVVPLRFTLDGDTMVASIDLSKVEYPENNPLVQIEFLQFFGSAVAGEKGYFLLPDGSGAIMPFQTVESGASYYQQAVYGKDQSMRGSITAAKAKKILLPVFGASYNQNSGFLAVIEDGEALADIFAYNSGSADAYNKVYSRINVLKTESVALGNETASDNFNYYHFQKKCYSGSYAVRYIFLERETCDYNGMAAAYRQYLLSTGSLHETKAEDSSPFLLETVGGILSDRSFLGFQYQGITALTTYEDNLAMVKTLRDAGVDNIKLRLTAFRGNGMQNLVLKQVKLIRSLGGTKAFRKLLSESENLGVSIYPNFTYLTFSANSGVLNKNRYAAQTLDSKAVELSVMNPATLLKNTQIEDNTYYLTAIGKLDELNQTVKGFLNQYNFKQMSIDDMASGSSSDFTYSASYDRQSASNKTSDIIADLSQNYDLILTAANVKNASNASLIAEAPLFSSEYFFCEGIPFYSMVFHGYVPYTGESLNLASNEETAFLRSIEYGANLKYTLVYRNKEIIKNSDYTNLYAAGFEENAPKAAERYAAISDIYNHTVGQTIVSHRKLADSVYYTEYANGYYTVVNYAEQDYACNYGTVPAKGFLTAK